MQVGTLYHYPAKCKTLYQLLSTGQEIVKHQSKQNIKLNWLSIMCSSHFLAGCFSDSIEPVLFTFMYMNSNYSLWGIKTLNLVIYHPISSKFHYLD